MMVRRFGFAPLPRTFNLDSVFNSYSRLWMEAVEMVGIVPALDLPAVVAPSRFGDYGTDAGVVSL